jgi:hypothetical protein
MLTIIGLYPSHVHFPKLLKKLSKLDSSHTLTPTNLLHLNSLALGLHTTVHPMSLLLNKLSTAINDKNTLLLSFVTFKKAFDTCNHSILLNKLHKLGVRGTKLKWFQSYLTDRIQLISINEFNSKLMYILTGVLQGSI